MTPVAAKQRRVVVIGAGLGGLAAALRLLAAGFEVTVVEGQDELGGRAGQIRSDGFTFDTGPSLITMPWLLDELFACAGTTSERELRLRRLDPFYRIHWSEQHTPFAFGGERERMITEIARLSAADARRYDGFLEASRRIYEEAILVAGRRSFLRRRDLVGLLPSMLRLGALRSVEGFVARFFAHPRVREAFGFHPLFIGGDPARVPAVYAALAYLQIAGGVWYAEGGTYALVATMARLVRARGGTIVTGDAVAGILRRDGRVAGVRTVSGAVQTSHFVVSNADVVTTTRLLLGRRGRTTPALSMSCFLMYLGCGRRFPELSHHTLLVGRGYHDFIADVTRRRRLPGSLSLYVHAPSRTEPSMAPPGGESISVLLPVPNLDGDVDWDEAGAALRERVLDALESDAGLGLRGLRQSIVYESTRDPRDFERRYGAASGNAFGPEPTLRQSASFRQPNRDRRIGGLYHVGAGTHPGAGIPGVLLGAEVTTRLLRDEAARA